MAKVVYKDLDKVLKGSKPAVREKSAIGPNGKLVTVRTVDANSATFAADATYAFRKSVSEVIQNSRDAGIASSKKR